jgi:hypothetical protein
MAVHAIQDRPAAMACQMASTRAPTHPVRYSVNPGYLALATSAKDVAASIPSLWLIRSLISVISVKHVDRSPYEKMGSGQTYLPRM